MNYNGVSDAYWKELFKLAQSTTSDGNAKTMDPKDREFLEEAMSEHIRKTDPNVQMANYIRLLRSTIDLNDENADHIGDIMSSLDNIVCQIDFACNFCKLGGIEEILRLMSCGSNSVKAEAIRLIPSVAQNNPNAQVYISNTSLLEDLLNLLTSKESNSAVRGSCLSAISSIVRGSDVLLKRLEELKGVSVLKELFKEAVSTNDLRIANKAAVVFANIVVEVSEKVAVKSGLRDALFEIFCDMPVALDACTYIRQRFAETALHDGLSQEALNKILSKLIEQLDFFHSSENADEEELEELKSCIEIFTELVKI